MRVRPRSSFARPARWRVVDGAIACVMVGTAARLVLGL
jgi:arginine exporter protein ArgO